MKEKWKVQESQSGKSNYNIVGEIAGNKHKIARIPFMSENEQITKETYAKLKEEALKHAKLIAAAPELLQLAIDTLNLCSMLKMPNESQLVELEKKCEVAINKALS